MYESVSSHTALVRHGWKWTDAAPSRTAIARTSGHVTQNRSRSAYRSATNAGSLNRASQYYPGK
ncbi:hypothetical protein FTUN_6227 [Frigoriglobus tundricola]|uniref:Uncharacterized protein n=1 Tax=Frigoriglobus tundricola TaxID=2774151 RepID=A0A6M5Z0A3_9BACT|nr:hypothetical protein FTUN_6227 [Frigoriglobus tundricola]